MGGGKRGSKVDVWAKKGSKIGFSLKSIFSPAHFKRGVKNLYFFSVPWKWGGSILPSLSITLRVGGGGGGGGGGVTLSVKVVGWW